MARIHELTPESPADARQLAEQALTIDARYGAVGRQLVLVRLAAATMGVFAALAAPLRPRAGTIGNISRVWGDGISVIRP